MPGPATRKRRGIEAEHDLAKKLWRHGFAVIRGPASGAKAKHVIYPDIVAIRKGRVLVFEVKRRTTQTTIYISREQVVKLREFAERAGGKAYIAVKTGNPGSWTFIRIEDLLETRNGNYKVTEELLREKGVGLKELVNMYTCKGLNEFSAG
ncbi:MAG: Holliday junction resolvase [Crenarchaeota archaeon]|nr:Holliday junction resolvase [Thermoproteota archaeon]